jgi:hypothetical protein
MTRIHNEKHFDHVLRGDFSVKSFYGKYNGRDLIFYIYKSGPNQGQIATSIIPSLQQMAKFGLRK